MKTHHNKPMHPELHFLLPAFFSKGISNPVKAKWPARPFKDINKPQQYIKRDQRHTSMNSRMSNCCGFKQSQCYLLPCHPANDAWYVPWLLHTVHIIDKTLTKLIALHTYIKLCAHNITSLIAFESYDIPTYLHTDTRYMSTCLHTYTATYVNACMPTYVCMINQDALRLCSSLAETNCGFSQMQDNHWFNATLCCTNVIQVQGTLLSSPSAHGHAHDISGKPTTYTRFANLPLKKIHEHVQTPLPRASCTSYYMPSSTRCG